MSRRTPGGRKTESLSDRVDGLLDRALIVCVEIAGLLLQAKPIHPAIGLLDLLFGRIGLFPRFDRSFLRRLELGIGLGGGRCLECLALGGLSPRRSLVATFVLRPVSSPRLDPLVLRAHQVRQKCRRSNQHQEMPDTELRDRDSYSIGATTTVPRNSALSSNPMG